MIPDHLIDKAAAAIYERIRKDNWKNGYGSGSPWRDLPRKEQYPYRRAAARSLEAVAANIWDEGWSQGMTYVTGMERGTDDDDLDHAITNPYKATED